jgi:site-specific recombinase XerD
MPTAKLQEIHIDSQTALPPAINAWVYSLADQGKSPNTIKAFRGDLNLLSSFLPEGTPLMAVTTNNLNGFLQWLSSDRGIPCSPKSLSRRITSLKAFFRWLFQNGRIETDPAEKVVQQSVISPLPEVLTEEEESLVVKAAENLSRNKKSDLRPLVLLTLLLETGLKKGECLALEQNHIELNDPAGPCLFVRYASPANRFKERKIEISHDWVTTYKAYLTQYQPMDKVFPWSPRRLEYILEDIGKGAGISKHLSFDMCRWTCALNDWRSNMEKDKIRQKLGISKIQWREISQKLQSLDLNSKQQV